MTDFAEFFEALWKDEKWPKPEPFPWQAMLAERAARGEWPEVINLPTASGKTACLDAAVFGLAATASATSLEGRMSRRIWFVVDRRIVVDEAFERAKRIAGNLVRAGRGPVREVADRLRALSGTDRPLAVARLRGGAWRDDGWARLPSQPAIICSTVDQVGSALLFRAYGHGDRTASIYAGLAAHDSLILLDEAHCAVPFLQTLRAVARFRGPLWAAEPLRTPFRYSIMSATPPSGIATEAVFPRPAERAIALDHPVLRQRFTASKTAILRCVRGGDDEFVQEAADRAREFAVGQHKSRVAVMVNRVATAEQIADHLSRQMRDSGEVVLLTGRMRPLDRDALVRRWEPFLKAGSTAGLAKPVIVVTTQCLEVGADFSFDALVTECASLDALRQRFGRLDRLGDRGESPAFILIREEHAKEPKDKDGDPVYGRAIYETWTWLNEWGQGRGGGSVNFAIESMDALVHALQARGPERFERLLAPAPDAPVLLPAHLDLLCQTSPRPAPEPDVTLFLHGKGRGAPDVRVVLRADLPDPASVGDAQDVWVDILSLVPPASPEMWTVPLYRLRRWLAEGEPDDVSADVEGAQEAFDDTEISRRPFLLWRGRDRSEFTRDLGRIRPDDVVVLRPTEFGIRGLGQTVAQPDGLGPERLDLAEPALRQARARAVLRLHSNLLAPWRGLVSVAHLLDLATAAEIDSDELKTALRAVLDETLPAADGTDQASLESLPGWMRDTITDLIEDGFRIEHHPAGGLVLVGKQRRMRDEAEDEDDPLADEEDLRSKSREPVKLREHIGACCLAAREFSTRCVGGEFEEVFSAAARGHDLGKLDPRFQIMLRNGFEDAADSEPLAKSEWLPERRRRRVEVREDARLPEGFRHEFLSMQLAERFGLTPPDIASCDLALHLIASHHGYARPFAPVVIDPLLEEGKAGDISLAVLGIHAALNTHERRGAPPSYRLDSGVADRFWRLTRRYGWWGLAYLEAVFRLSDWQASRRPKTAAEAPLLASSPAPASGPRFKVALDALDGSNPLGFLAAVGTLRLLTHAFPDHDLRLSWSQRSGAWRPLLWANKALDEKAMLQALHEKALNVDAMFSAQLLAASEAASPKNKKGEARWKDKLLFPVSALRAFCEAATVQPGRSAEYSATWAGETAPSGEQGEEIARRTRFDFTAGQQAFIRMLRELRESCTVDDLRCALMSGWRYSSAAVSMRWDIQDEKRQYALQAVDPTNSSENPPLADRGANFLAVEALPLFPLVPDRWASQPGFSRDADGHSWRWPIWIHPLGLDVIRSLLALPLADAEQWPPLLRRAVGVATVFESAIVQPSGRYRCFTPARSI